MIQVTSFESFKQSRSHVPAALKADVAVPTLIVEHSDCDELLWALRLTGTGIPSSGLYIELAHFAPDGRACRVLHRVRGRWTKPVTGPLTGRGSPPVPLS